MQMSWLPSIVLSLLNASAAPLPSDVRHAIEKDYVAEGRETRYVDGSVDLNGDGRNELIVHVIGSAACGSGGCPTLVFTPAGDGFHRVATIGLTYPPIAVSPQRSHGWRNLIVRIGGGGAKAGDVEIAFDGKTYAHNPTVQGPGVTSGSAGGDVVIAVFARFDETKPLAPGTVPAVPVPPGEPASSPGGPSFDCAKAALPVEKAICASPELAVLDRELATTFADTLRTAADAQGERQREVQKQWLIQRNGCGNTADAAVCLRDAYRRRIVELQIQSGRFATPTPRTYRCTGHATKPLLAAFYPAADPGAVMLTWGDRRALVFVAPSGSGARYVGDGVEFWEQQGEIRVTWGADSLRCAAP